MNRIIRKAISAFCILWIFAGALHVQAAEGMDTVPMDKSGIAALESEGDGSAEFAAPAYGTKAEVSSKLIFAQQVTAAASFWQETVEQLAPFTYGHNVGVNNYSDPDALGLVYESEGSGVIIAMDDNFVYISTAAHCLKRTNTVVEFADGSRHSAAIVYRNPAKDVGFLIVPRAELKEETLAVISPAAGADAEALGKINGDVLFVVSSVDEPNGDIYAGILDQYSVVYPNNPAQNVMQFFSDVSHGSSGGAVYTAEGIWVGSVSGGDTYGICWAVPYQDILSEFNAWLELLAIQQAASADAA